MNKVITREDGTQFVNVSINIDPIIIEAIDKEVKDKGTDRSALIQSNLKAWHIDDIVKKLHQKSVCEHHVNIDLHKELKQCHKTIKRLKREQVSMSIKKDIDYGKWANRFFILSMAFGLSLAFGWWS